MFSVSSDLSHLYEFTSFEHTRKPPVIGLTLDDIDTRQDSDSFWYSEYPWYAIGRRYMEAIVRAGGIPVALGRNLSSASYYADILDGLLLAGSGFDIEPVLYGENIRHKTTIPQPSPMQAVWALAQKMLVQAKPLFGIGSGMQLINVLKGGSLIQHIPEEVPEARDHAQHMMLIYPYHKVEIVQGTKFYESIYRFDATYAESIKNSYNNSLFIQTNSYHHQAVKKLGKGLKVTAQTDDGIIEGIEASQGPFCVGVEWQAEFLMNPVDLIVFKNFIDAAREGRM
ncbi:gamma-glutamyl-gamma-aminobutyrate hydrolase [Alphaproteobacteria bacterium]|nr:gamma-glutamyl-gamma-aminobutyrate hydrolase [Alphaproteobacteria bacterium]GHS96279.1 gamma-glutamyl-gamma-aminobutyrate hydrolase [Alphaproteobacteria bacterium]